MSAISKKNERFKVGDWVSFPYGTSSLIAQISEARGPLGVNRRFLYGIRVPRDDEAGEPDSFEMPEDDLEAAAPPGKDAIIKYLKDGGLVEILRANLGNGPKQPRAWLTFTPRGRVTHTFAADRGFVGGASVPFFALHEGKIFTGKKEEVVGFLSGFGLDKSEAQEVLGAVGKAP